MNLGLPLIILGVLGVVVGGVFFLARFHHTIGKVGIVIGVILLILGLLLNRQYSSMLKRSGGPPPAQPQS